MAVAPGMTVPGPTKKRLPGGGMMVSSAATSGGLGAPKPPAGGLPRQPGGLPTPFRPTAPPPVPGVSAYPGMVPQNPTTMHTYGPLTQQTDQMGRVITRQADGRDPFTGANLGGGGTTIEDPDAIRRRRDLLDYEERGLINKRLNPERWDPGDPEEELDIQRLINLFPGGGSAPREMPITAPPRVEGMPEADRRAAEAAEFGRAKDRVGKITSGAMRSLDAANAGLGREGIAARNQRDIVRSGMGELADVAREQAIQALKRRNEVEDRNYSGDITQRSQDIGVRTTNLGAGVTQRGQDLDASRSLISALPSLASLTRRRLVVR